MRQLLIRMYLMNLVLLIFSFSFKSALTQNQFVNSFYFSSNSYKIDNRYIKTLNEIGEKCKSDTLTFMRIFAFTDTTGSIEYNDELSKKRAYQVYNYLVKKFTIDTTKIYVEWIGEDSDVYDLHYSPAHAQERCVDVITNFKKEPN